MDDGGAWKVGLITILAVVGILAMLAFLVPGVHSVLTGGRWSLYILFNDAGGLQPAEGVLMSGVPIGTVDSVRLVTNPDSRECKSVNESLAHSHIHPPTPPYALVKVNISRSAAGQLYRSYSYQVGSSSLIGATQQITIIPTGHDDLVHEGDVVIGTGQLSLTDMTKPAVDMMTAVTDLTRQVQNLVADPRLKMKINSAMDQANQAAENMRTASEQIETLAATTNSILSGALPHVGNSITNVEAMTADVRSATDRMPGMMDQAQGAITDIRTNLTLASQHADQALQNINSSTARIKTFTSDSGSLEDLHTTILNLKQASDRLNGVMANVQSMTTSEQFQKDLPQIVANLKEATAELTPTLEQARHTMKTIDNVGQNADNLLGNLGGGKNHGEKEKPATRMPRQLIGVQSGIGLLYTGNPNHEFPHSGLVDPEFQFNLGSHTYTLGLYDLGGKNQITAQVGVGLYGSLDRGLGLRYGVYRSKAGMGLDWILDPKLGIYTNLYDPNNPTLDLETSYSLTKDYSLWAGVDQLNRQVRPFVGLRIKP